MYKTLRKTCPLIFIAFNFLPLITLGEEICETSPNAKEVQYVINLVKRQFNVSTFKCTYTVIVDDLPSYIELLKEDGVKVNEKYISKGEIKTLDFIYKEGNFVRTISGIKEVEEEEIVKETPYNSIEALILKAREKRMKKKVDYPLDYKIISYFYNGTLKIRHYSFCPVLNRYAYSADILGDNRDGLGRYLDARVCIGYCKEESRVNPFLVSPIYITDFLEKEGKFYYYEKDGYRILWHGVLLNRGRLTVPICLEVWIDSNDNIYKIRSIFYPTRFIERGNLKKILPESSYNCEYPSLIFWEYTYYEHKEFANHIKLPMRITVMDYDYYQKATRYPELRSMIGECITGKTDIITLYSQFCQYPDISVPSEKREILIHPESVVINEPIPEETFIAPEPDIPSFKSPEEAKEFIRKAGKERMARENPSKFNIPISAMVFVSGCVLVVLIGMFITKRYFGWGT